MTLAASVNGNKTGFKNKGWFTLGVDRRHSVNNFLFLYFVSWASVAPRI